MSKTWYNGQQWYWRNVIEGGKLKHPSNVSVILINTMSAMILLSIITQWVIVNPLI